MIKISFTTFVAGTKAEATLVNDNFIENPHQSPVGTVASWLKSYTNTPALTNGWVECNGQTLSDADSVYNGQVIPNLNGGARFLYGGYSSGSTKTEEFLPSHTHTVLRKRSLGGYSSDATYNAVVNDTDAADTKTAGTAWVAYSVVWIMRVK